MREFALTRATRRRARRDRPLFDDRKSVKAKRTRKERAAAARMLAKLRAGEDVRTRKVRKLRAAIKVKRYENSMKLAVALGKVPL